METTNCQIPTASACQSFDVNSMSQFKNNNPHCEIAIDEGFLVIEKPWGTDDTRLVFECSADEKIKDLNKLVLNPQFDAIIHIDTNTVEFIYAFLSTDSEITRPYIDREFEIFFNGIKFKCYFGEPTERLFFIASSVKRIPTDSGIMVVPQLKAFKDFQKKESLPHKISSYFENKIPRSFFVSPETKISEVNLESAFRHINFLTNYYDRRSPYIEIRNEDADEQHMAPSPVRYFENEFPPSLSINQIDDVVLKLLEVSRHTPPRYAFLYLYQIIEYAGFYFIDENAKKSLRTFLRDPSLINCDDGKIGKLMSVLTDLQCNDDVKMKRVIEYYCNPETLWKEIENDKSFFSSKIEFAGGFELPALISSDTTPSAWATMWMPKLYDHLTKIRNGLVHARERRQDKVILPTLPNNKKISRYLPLMRRLAEQLAICSVSTNSHPVSLRCV